MMRWITMAATLSMVGCTSVTPNLPSHEVNLPGHYTLLSGEQGPTTIEGIQQIDSTFSLSQQWWTLFQSDEITALVEQGLENSPTLAAAQGRLRAAEALYRSEQDAAQLPTVDLSINGSRTESSGALVGQVGSGSMLSLEQIELQMSYRVDLFGGEAAKVRNQQAAVMLEQYQLEQARVVLSGNIVNTVLQIASLEAQMEALQQIIEDEAAQLAVTEQQYQIGVIPKSDLLGQRASLAQTRTQMPALQKSHVLAQHQLALLLGETAVTLNLPKVDLMRVTLPQQLPFTLPSEMTRQRADVHAAQALLEQRAAAVGIAAANRYPSLSLSANYGAQSNDLSDLMSGSAVIWGVGAGLLHPLFHGEVLAAREQSAVEQFNAQAATYRQTVLNAFREVADALRTLQLDSEQLALSQDADRLASQTLQLVEQQHHQGAVSYLTLLNAQRQLQQTRIQTIQARTALYRDSVALLVALGGGWWNSVEEKK